MKLKAVHRSVLPALALLSCLPGDVAAAPGRGSAFEPPPVQPSREAESDPARFKGLVAVQASVDAGEVSVGAARLASVMFENAGSDTVRIQRVIPAGDGTLSVRQQGEDCSAVGELPPRARCVVTMVVTPLQPGPWNAEVVVLTDGPGRLARAEIKGRATERPVTPEIPRVIVVEGLDEKNRLDFGELEADRDAGSRTVILRNRLDTPFTVSDASLVVAEDGMSVLGNGCIKGAVVEPGGSCSVTVVWRPKTGMRLSTELIVRHNARHHPAIVVPIEGVSKDNAVKVAKAAEEAKAAEAKGVGKAAEIEALMKSMGVSIDKVHPTPSASEPASKNVQIGVRLVGTLGVGSGKNDVRVILADEAGKGTVIGRTGETVSVGSHRLRIISASSGRVEVEVEGVRRTLRIDDTPPASERKTTLGRAEGKTEMTP